MCGSKVQYILKRPSRLLLGKKDLLGKLSYM